MPVLYLDGSVLWLGLMFLLYWNFFRVYSDFSVTLLWTCMIYVVKRVMRRVFCVLEWAAGVNLHGAGELAAASLDGAMDTRLLWPVPALVVLGYLAGTKATITWCSAFLLLLALMCWSSRVEWQAAAWPDRRCWRFRAFTFVSGCLALLCAALQWSYFATCPRPRDDANETVHYTLLLWSATLSIQLLQAFIFIVLHVFYAATALDRDGGGFDPMENTGLTVRCMGAAASFLAATVYCSDGATTFMKLSVITHFCFLLNEVLVLRRSWSVLLPFQEVHLSGHCVICLDSIKPCELARRLHCGHVFHSRCLYRWLMRSDQCPTCRHSTDPTHDELLRSVEFTLERRRGRRQRAQNMQDIGVQTTFELEYALRPATFQGSLQPLLRPAALTVETRPQAGDSSSSSSALMTEMPPTAPVMVGGQTSPPIPTPSPRQGELSSFEATTGVPRAGPPAEAAVSDEFADNPIVHGKGRGPRPTRRRRAVEEMTRTAATVDGADAEADEIGVETAPFKKVKMEKRLHASEG
ncbi:hypothetical protein TraAM80_03916 [Trypanosoma rangeli]|uniref:RING-type domain-containing protein n=1 Tax=Trypanosoma rangeli TaxID=5698 RepID=A0A3R7NH33_TRYRA|nr:uncharacterized protein TraAM80_03916 [Trypanosoma rangeli]RNF06462.1 hypothetical protein TraAM80_03916 [Trypanosoma rangeli]|eukprot:RNF06462.1 hypothetical protein TraAM80_03916 [Trypanosoma rangeli]